MVTRAPDLKEVQNDKGSLGRYIKVSISSRLLLLIPIKKNCKKIVEVVLGRIGRYRGARDYQVCAMLLLPCDSIPYSPFLPMISPLKITLMFEHCCKASL